MFFRFTVQLAERLNELRKEQEEDDYEQLNPRRFQTDFSSFNELNGEVFDFEEAHAQIDKNYDWDEQNKLFTEEQITQMQGWIEQQKLIHNEEIKMK